MITSVGSVTALWRFPVKSMGGESLAEVDLEPQGLPGDRAFAIFDVATGRVASAKNTDLFPGLLDCKAAFVESPRPGHALPPARITLPGGPAVTSDSPGVDRALSAHFGRDVRLVRAGGDVAPKIYSAFLAEVGLEPPARGATFFDLFPVSVITTSTLARLAEVGPGSRFDARRFRMNVVVDTPEPGLVENAWIGRDLGLGGAARLRVALPDPRCALTTLAQDELPKDAEILRTMVRHNTIQVGAGGRYPCAGVYAVVATGGSIRTGDGVTVG